MRRWATDGSIKIVALHLRLQKEPKRAAEAKLIPTCHGEEALLDIAKLKPNFDDTDGRGSLGDQAHATTEADNLVQKNPIHEFYAGRRNALDGALTQMHVARQFTDTSLTVSEVFGLVREHVHDLDQVNAARVLRTIAAVVKYNRETITHHDNRGTLRLLFEAVRRRGGGLGLVVSDVQSTLRSFVIFAESGVRVDPVAVQSVSFELLHFGNSQVNVGRKPQLMRYTLKQCLRLAELGLEIEPEVLHGLMDAVRIASSHPKWFGPPAALTLEVVHRLAEMGAVVDPAAVRALKDAAARKLTVVWARNDSSNTVGAKADTEEKDLSGRNDSPCAADADAEAETTEEDVLGRDTFRYTTDTDAGANTTEEEIAEASAGAGAKSCDDVGEDKDDHHRLRTWKRLLEEMPTASVLLKDPSTGGKAVVRRMAFYGDRYLNASVAHAMQLQHPPGIRNARRGSRGNNTANKRALDTTSLGRMSTLFGKGTSNMLLARLLPRLLTPDMVAAVPAAATSADTKSHQHKLGTMVEAVIFLVYEGFPEGPDAVAEVGAFLLAHAGASSDSKGRPQAERIAAKAGVKAGVLKTQQIEGDGSSGGGTRDATSPEIAILPSTSLSLHSASVAALAFQVGMWMALLPARERATLELHMSATVQAAHGKLSSEHAESASQQSLLSRFPSSRSGTGESQSSLFSKAAASRDTSAASASDTQASPLPIMGGKLVGRRAKTVDGALMHGQVSTGQQTTTNTRFPVPEILCLVLRCFDWFCVL